MKFSIIIPVYNRPDEVDELLSSLLVQTYTDDYEILVIEDGSVVPCDSIVQKYADRLPIRYFSKANSGPGQTRNYGAERAQGEYLLILDSDVVLPSQYLLAIDKSLIANPVDAFGGPDCAHESFTPVQKAINYSMTSFFTTGGIRGKKKSLDKFFPRSFNMGIRRDVFAALGGFSNMRFGEDVDFSMRIVEVGYTTSLFPDAYVYHKRRTDFRKFFRQVFNSGIARISLTKRHPGSLKLVHMLPALFTIGVFGLLLLSAVNALWLSLLGLCVLLILVDSSVQNKSVKIGILSVVAAFTQLMGYGLGFILAAWRRYVLHQPEFEAFHKTFYK